MKYKFCKDCHSCIEPCGRTIKEEKGMSSEAILLLVIALGIFGVMVASFYFGIGLIGFLILLAACGYILEEFAKPLLRKITGEENKE